MTCTHHWSVTSYCPYCLFDDNDRLRASLDSETRLHLEEGARDMAMIIGLKDENERLEAELREFRLHRESANAQCAHYAKENEWLFMELANCRHERQNKTEAWEASQAENDRLRARVAELDRIAMDAVALNERQAARVAELEEGYPGIAADLEKMRARVQELEGAILAHKERYFVTHDDGCRCQLCAALAPKETP